MAPQSWDKIHHAMWRLAEWPALPDVLRAARSVRLAPGTAAAEAVAALDGSGLVALLDSGFRAERAALATFELSRESADVAACLLSSYLPQLGIREFGTPAQRERYLDRARFPHGALCVTEALPGAGAESAGLLGTASVIGRAASGEAVLRVRKRGRFISHMQFADFVLAAIDPADSTLASGCLVLLEPTDPGVFDRGAPVRKFGHPRLSVTCPTFDVETPASRILGGYREIQGRIVPAVAGRDALRPMLRFGRAMAALMTAGGAHGFLDGKRNSSLDQDSLPEIWAGAEAASSLAFAAARAVDPSEAILVPAAKLFASAFVASRLPGRAAARIADAQVEATLFGTEAVQRREIFARAGNARFTILLARWAEELAALGAPLLADGFQLWLWTLDYVRRTRDPHGTTLAVESRHGVTFLFADALCRLLAARALVLDARQSETCPDALAGLGFVECVVAAGELARVCATLVFGYGEPPAEDRAHFYTLRENIYRSFRGLSAARALVNEVIRVHSCPTALCSA